MNDEENKIIEKIEKLIALSGSDNENEAKAAMLKAQELMAKYEIEQDRIDPERKKERPVVCFTSPMFRDDWCVDVGSLIANNFRCRAIISQRRNSGGAYRLKFFGFEEDAEISINVFNYAVKVIRKRMATLRAIYRDAEREFGRNEKMAYVDGFCSGLYRNFEEQKKQSESFALALLVPEAVVKFVDEIPGMEEYNRREYQQKHENDVLRQAGYVDGKAFQNAGDKERPAKDRKNMKIQIETRVNKAPVRAAETNMFIGQELDGSPAFYTSDEQIPGQMRLTEGG